VTPKRWCFRCKAFADHSTAEHVDPPSLFDPADEVDGRAYAHGTEQPNTTGRALEEIDARILSRTEDPGTSHAAAASLGGSTGTMRRRILEAFARAPQERISGDLTADEVMTDAGYGPQDGTWKRVSDLLGLGFLEDTGWTRAGRSGRQQRVLRISEAGRRALLGDAAETG